MDVEKTIQFLLEQQARFDARQFEFVAEFAAHQAEFADRQAKFEAKFEEDITRINSVILSLATTQERTNAILERLAEKHVELAEAQRSTEQKLHAVISALERHIENHT
jgi:endonuclease III